eukprot:gene9730-13095_t
MIIRKFLRLFILIWIVATGSTWSTFTPDSNLSDLPSNNVDGNIKSYEKLFFQYQIEQNQFFMGDDYFTRLKIFKNNFEKIQDYNNDFSNSVKLKLNQFSHLTYDEFIEEIRTKNSLKNGKLRRNDVSIHSTINSTQLDLPLTIDWASTPAVTSVRKQGRCSSSWSMAATSALEGAYFLKYGESVLFSVQQLVSCDSLSSNEGCNGGSIEDAYEFMRHSGGIARDSDYPYTSGITGNNGACLKSSTYPGSGLVDYTTVLSGSMESLMSAVSIQPVAVTLTIDHSIFQFYSSGILSAFQNVNHLPSIPSLANDLNDNSVENNNEHNSNVNLLRVNSAEPSVAKVLNKNNHAALLVGYGNVDGKDYWKIKNSWGDTWGKDGYLLIERSNNNAFGILNEASFPNL